MKPTIGISSCLLGNNVRYDGSHKMDRYIKNILGAYVEFIPVCPEVECGLPVPRPSMRLVGDPEKPRLVVMKTGEDLTEKMKKWSDIKLDGLAKEGLSGFIFKSKSPSSGMQGVKVYSEKGMPSKKGVGVFAHAFMKRFPKVPVEDEGRLHDDGLRKNFIEHVFVHHRWNEYVLNDASAHGLIVFHAMHKLVFMAHSPSIARELGKIVGSIKGKVSSKTLQDYSETLHRCMSLLATVRKNVNVLQHIMGYFKRDITGWEKQELLKIIQQYHEGLIPIIVPLTLLNHYTKKYQSEYLQKQMYLNPHPFELKLLNHV